MRSFALVLLACLSLAGCYRMQTLRRQAAKLGRFVEIEGRVARPEGASGALVVELLHVARSDAAPDTIVDRAVLVEAGEFRFVVRPSSRYVLVAFVDSDGDLALDVGERWTTPRPWSGQAVLLEPNETAETPGRNVLLSRGYDLGTVVRIDEPRFAEASGEYGIWQPLRWPQRFPMGVFFTEPFDPARVPVLFVYGIGGFARQLDPFVGRLDPSRYQAWFVNYPTGLPIAQVAAWLRRALDELHAQLDFSRLCVIAHSMGGLVARALWGSFDGDGYARGLTTIATPFGGLGSAGFGVSWSPAVAPAWRDLAPGSELLTHLFDRPGPSEAQRDLIFLFEPGDTGDGVVPLASQLRTEAQREAQQRAGFPVGHAEALASPEVWAQVASGLDRCAATGGSNPRDGDRK